MWNARVAEPRARTAAGRGSRLARSASSWSRATTRASARPSGTGSGTDSGTARRRKRSTPRTNATPRGTSASHIASASRNRRGVSFTSLDAISSAPPKGSPHVIELRRYQRAPLEVDVAFTLKGGQERLAGRSKDISLGGMFVLTAKPAAFGAEVVVYAT